MTVIKPVISPKFKSTTNYPVPRCAACKLASATKCNPGVIKQAAIPEKEAIP